jgi:TolB protein
MIFIFIFTACTTPKIATETKTSEVIVKNKIAFRSERDGNPEIYIMNVDGSEQTRLTNNPASDVDPSFSP